MQMASVLVSLLHASFSMQPPRHPPALVTFPVPLFLLLLSYHLCSIPLSLKSLT